MQPEQRYQIGDMIAKGDFATVYRAHDLELDRDVAVKQIHQQYLDDPAQLEQYWGEAQLLASLEHPFIMSIHDLVRERGWLILELMQGNVRDRLAGEPCDLNYLRLTISYVLHALNFLEKNGIVHGDVKPTNLLLDRENRVKLGDFGIARRVTGDDGSLVKGTTKYMAPEVFAEQFGPVGFHSDLYSLGFTAFELMCGANFETLFPGLNMFGRDQQVAWMMWHAAPERQLPEISRVLEGVPEDLAHVIQRLTQKDPALRYRRAEEALADLRTRGHLGPEPPVSRPSNEEDQEAKRGKQRRMLTIAAVAVSLLLSLTMLFVPTGKTPPRKEAVVAVGPAEGAVSDIDTRLGQLILEPADGTKPIRVVIDTDHDRIMLNGQLVEVSALKVGDQISVEQVTRADGRKFQEIVATRGQAQSLLGSIDSVRPADRMIVVLPGGDEAPGPPLSVYVPSTVRLRLNGKNTFDGRPVRLTDAQPNDRVELFYLPDENPPVATACGLLRFFTLEGRLVSADPAKRRITLDLGQGPEGKQQAFDVAADCVVSLNGATVVDGRVFSLDHLKAGDRVAVRHDAQVTRIDAVRDLTATGVVTEVAGTGQQIGVRLEGQPIPTEFAIDPQCDVQIVGNDKPVDVAYLRPGDRVAVTHQATDLKDAVATSIAVEPHVDRRVWAVVVVQTDYDDSRLDGLHTAGADADLIRESLGTFYRVADDQLFFEADPIRARLEEQLPEFLQRVTPGSQLIVYFAGHGFFDQRGKPVLALKDFDPSRRSSTGLPLNWLLAQMESCPPGEKVLLLDTACTHDDALARLQPASAELAKAAAAAPGRPLSPSVVVVTNCSPGERKLVETEEPHGLFARSVAGGYDGKADTNGDDRVDADELVRFLEAEMKRLAPEGQPQTPYCYLPDPTPDRLTAEAREAARLVLAYAQSSQLNDEALKSLTEKYADARFLAPNQPDVHEAYGLALLKHGKTLLSLRVFEELVAEHPESAVGQAALAWQNFNKRNYPKGIKHLVTLVRSLPQPPPGQQYDPYLSQTLQWAGAMREFALSKFGGGLNRSEVNLLDQAVLNRDEPSKTHFATGIQHVRKKGETISQQIQDTSDAARKAAIAREAGRLTYYTSFDFESAASYLAAKLSR
jgi:serine/threonine-protein kinase